MPKRAIALVVILLICAGGIYGLYDVSPFGRHDRQAAAYEKTLRGRVVSVGDVQIISGRHHVGGNEFGAGGECSLQATLTVSTPLARREFHDRLKAVLARYTDEYLRQQVTQLPDDQGRHVFRIVAATLGEGGTIDLRCG